MRHVFRDGGISDIRRCVDSKAKTQFYFYLSFQKIYVAFARYRDIVLIRVSLLEKSRALLVSTISEHVESRNNLSSPTSYHQRLVFCPFLAIFQSLQLD